MEHEREQTAAAGTGQALRAIDDLARAAQGAYEVAELLERICVSVAVNFGFERTGITRYAPDTGRLEFLAGHGVAVADVRQLPDRLDDWPIFRKALETRDLVYVEDVRAEGALGEGVAHALGIRTALVLPLFSRERCLGFLSADHGGEPFTLDREAFALLRTIAALASSYLDKALVHEELLRLDRLKSSFIALASHELRTPAAVIYGISSTLYQRGGELTEEQLSDLRRALYDQSERMRQLVDQLLDLSRLEANAIRIRPEPIRVRRRIEELVFTVVPDRAADIDVAVPDDLEALADGDAFDRILANLITNAVRYGAPPVRVSAEQRDRHFRFAVEDRGRGVAPEFVPHLFERFTRGESSAAAVTGAGLGLSIAQSYAQAHGGNLSYEPARPHGARFELVLPRADAPADGAAETNPLHLPG